MNNQKVGLFKTITSEEFSDIKDIKKILLGLKRHLYLIIVSGVIFALLGIYTTYKMLKVYKAEAILIYNDEKNTPKDIPGGYPLIIPSLATSVDMIMMPKNFEAVKSILGLDLPPEAIMGMVNIPPSKLDSKMRRIEVRNNNPHLAVDIANVLAKVVVKNSQEFTRSQLVIALENFRKLLAEANKALNKKNEEIEEFKKEHQYFEAGPNYVLALTELQTTKSQLAQMDLNYQSLLVEYENLKKQAQLIPDRIPINRDTKDNIYKTRIITLETALAQAKAKYTPDNPKIKSMEDELNELLKKMKGSSEENQTDGFTEVNPVKETIAVELIHLQGKVRSAQKGKEELTQIVKDLENKLQNVPEQQLFLGKLLQSKQLAEDQVKFLSNSLESIQLLMNAPNGILDLYALAKEATPANDKWWVNFITAFTLLFGLGLGAVLATLLEISDRYIRTGKEVQINYTVPWLLTIPEISHFSLANGEKKSSFYMRDLIDKIDKISFKGESRTIVFTSSKEKEGKSFLSYYLAQYYKFIGKKVLVLEFDEAFNPLFSAPVHSLNALIDNPSILQDTNDFVRINDNHISLKTTLKSNAFEEFWNKLKSRYDHIIIEAPGIVTDHLVVNLSHLSDVLLFIIGSNKTEKKWVDESLHLLESYGIVPSGIILNRVNPVYIDDERIKIEMAKR